MTTPFGKAKIQLVPWDFGSADHRDRLLQQRVACGFGTESVERWERDCRAGNMAMYWIILANDSPNRAEHLAVHMEKYPEDSIPLTDTARTTFDNPRDLPSATPGNFFPVGHVGLARRPEVNAKFGLPSDSECSITWLMGIYTSWVLQGAGIGYAAMQTMEKMAIDLAIERNGPSDSDVKIMMVLDTIPASFQFSEMHKRLFYEERGLEVPKISLQQWYEKQGYVQFDENPAGNTWTKGEITMIVPLVYYQKVL